MAKLAFKKRCPYCKSILLDRVHRKSWMRLIPIIKSYNCKNCLHNFITIFNISDILEQRISQRFRIKSGIAIKLSPHFPKVNSLLDISNRGLSFSYITDKKNGKIPLNSFRTEIDNRIEKLEIIHNADNLYLKEIPFRVRWGLESNGKILIGNKETRMCGVEFVNLTRNQKFQLQSFTQKYRQN